MKPAHTPPTGNGDATVPGPPIPAISWPGSLVMSHGALSKELLGSLRAWCVASGVLAQRSPPRTPRQQVSLVVQGWPHAAVSATVRPSTPAGMSRTLKRLLHDVMATAWVLRLARGMAQPTPKAAGDARVTALAHTMNNRLGSIRANGEFLELVQDAAHAPQAAAAQAIATQALETARDLKALRALLVSAPEDPVETVLLVPYLHALCTLTGARPGRVPPALQRVVVRPLALARLVCVSAPAVTGGGTRLCAAAVPGGLHLFWDPVAGGSVDAHLAAAADAQWHAAPPSGWVVQHALRDGR